MSKSVKMAGWASVNLVATASLDQGALKSINWLGTTQCRPIHSNLPAISLVTLDLNVDQPDLRKSSEYSDGDPNDFLLYSQDPGLTIQPANAVENSNLRQASKSPRRG